MKQRMELDQDDIKAAISGYLNQLGHTSKPEDVSLVVDPGDPGHYADRGPRVHANALVGK
jgi:hypothetical protein